MPPKFTSEILQELRNIMKNTNHVCRSLQGYVVPSCDYHQSEYIAPCDERRAFISGFKGSLGTAVVTVNEAQLWTDPRYTLQAKQELDENWTLLPEGGAEHYCTSKRLTENLPAGSYIGVDPFLIPYRTWSTLANSLKRSGHKLVPVKTNLIDIIWKDKPTRQSKKINCLSVAYTGQGWQEKVKEVQDSLKTEKAGALIFTALDEIAWLFNLRGADIPYNPVFFAYAAITTKDVFLLLNEDCLTNEARKSLEQPLEDDKCLKLHSYESITSVVQDVLTSEDGKIWIDSSSSYGLVSLIPEDRRLIQMTPVSSTKAVKNESEIAASKRAHMRDAVALCELFCWISKEMAGGNITEIKAAEKLEEFKKMQDFYIGPSFETISATGPNGAVIHYRPCPETDRRVTSEEIYLCDSGSQYEDGGTTDVTRTLHFGSPSEFEKECYTLVLKGVIRLTTAIFPCEITGGRIDAFARQALWESGLDYLHGTGHGVGAYLNVHEGPMGIGYRPRSTDNGLEPGMILSIEPGYYEDGKFGVRLENLVLIVLAKTRHNFKDKKFVTFETLTKVPYQRKMLKPSLLNEKEIQWLNDYHSSCREDVGKLLREQGKKEALQWLMAETEPLG